MPRPFLRPKYTAARTISKVTTKMPQSGLPRNFAASWQQFLSIESKFHSRLNTLAFTETEDSAMHVPAMLSDIHFNPFGSFDESELLQFAFAKLRRAARLTLLGRSAEGTDRREARRALTCLVLRQLCRMLLTLHEAAALQRGVTSSPFVAALARQFSLLQRFKEMVRQIEWSTCVCDSTNMESAKPGDEHSKCRLHIQMCHHGILPPQACPNLSANRCDLVEGYHIVLIS